MSIWILFHVSFYVFLKIAHFFGILITWYRDCVYVAFLRQELLCWLNFWECSPLISSWSRSDRGHCHPQSLCNVGHHHTWIPVLYRANCDECDCVSCREKSAWLTHITTQRMFASDYQQFFLDLPKFMNSVVVTLANPVILDPDVG